MIEDTMTEPAEYRYDVFISYSHRDKNWVQGWLLSRLERAGLRVCIDFRDFEPGLPSLVNMENAVERSRKTLIVLTPAWVESEWAIFENLLIQTDDPAGRRARMIPLWLKPCKPPKRIAILTYVDFTQPVEAEFQLQRLVAAIRGEPMSEVSRPVRDRRIDAAAPSHAEVGRRIDLLVQVRFPDSPLLGIKDWPTKQKPSSIEQVSERATLEFPVDHRTGKLGSARLEIRVVTPDFRIEGAVQQLVEVPPDRYSKRISFLLTAMKAGSCRINVEVYSVDHIYLGTIPVETTVSGAVTTPSVSVATLVVFVLVHQPDDLKMLGWDEPSIEERAHLKRELNQHKRNLRLLRQKKAVYAVGEEPLYLLTQIEAEKEEIQSIEQRLAQITEKPLPAPTPPPSPKSKPSTTEAELESLQRQLVEARENLRLIEERMAAFVMSTDIPLQLVKEKQRLQSRIADLERCIARWQQLNEAIEAEAQERKQLAKLYSRGMACFRVGKWAEASKLFQQILRIDENYKDTSERLIQAEKQERLEQLYARVKQAEANHDWQLMITVCREIIGIAPHYHDVQRLLWKARSCSTKQHVGAIWAHYKTAISILAILLMVAGIVKLTMSVWPTAPQISVEAFLITKGENQIITAKPGTTITATVGEIVPIEVEFSTTGQEQEEGLLFTWYTCREGNKPVDQSISNSEMLYVAPGEPGPDCICVVIEKGGVLLDQSEIFVDLQM